MQIRCKVVKQYFQEVLFIQALAKEAGVEHHETQSRLKSFLVLFKIGL
jgi:hypothetical protein